MPDSLAEFSVVEFYADDTHAYVECWLVPRKAVELASKCMRRACHNGSTVERVIITDGGDNTCFEWKRRVGVTFPFDSVGARS